MTNGVTKDFIDSLTANERTDLLAGLTNLHLKRTASDALMASSLLTHYLRALGMNEEAEYMANLQHRLFDLT
jgi:hypothetical protein